MDIELLLMAMSYRGGPRHMVRMCHRMGLSPHPRSHRRTLAKLVLRNQCTHRMGQWAPMSSYRTAWWVPAWWVPSCRSHIALLQQENKSSN